MNDGAGVSPRPLEWVGSSKKDLMGFPGDVQDTFGFALYVAQCGRMPADTKPLDGYRGTTVCEVLEDYQTDTYRVVYVTFPKAIFCLHAYKKKSNCGIKTPRREEKTLKLRLMCAKQTYSEKYGA